ncbi:uncharacterized protein NPIL_496021 [Nephila pilipes]|uniref:Uncharacterized protein n=1 Tax=Nephila pilipes TaxID=299642 RepID=A0A8X6NZF1_NEPPI|nr:uncharacterized protein NPIL_496021 [Nephila pilipes]
MTGSNKINGNCPSKMKVCEDIESQVYVEFTKTHLGHRKYLGRMIHLVSRKDLLNLKVECNISSDGIMDSNYVVSVGKWIESLQDQDSPIILFKDQNISNEDLYPGLKAEDFLLVIMSSSQRDMLNVYGNDTICLYFPHGMNAYGFD